MKTAPSILDVSGLRITRDRTTILHDVAWRVRRGEHWVILGPNGCGKTSLLKALAGFLPPSAGEFALLGQRYGHCDWRELRRHLGLVSSALQASIPPGETALETVVSGRYAQLDLWARITPADATAARRLLRVVGAGALADRAWQLLSQGERQRVLIARALAARPRLLILDEPCSGLDPVARETFLHFLDRLARSPRTPTLVFVTHHVEEIMPCFTHALVLRRGGVLATGPLRRTLTSCTLTAALGAPARLRRAQGRYRLTVQLPAHATAACT